MKFEIGVINALIVLVAAFLVIVVVYFYGT